MAKNDGFAEVRDHHFLEPFGWQVIINHYEGEPEIWDTFQPLSMPGLLSR